MIDIILQIIMMLGAGIAGYSIRVLQKPDQKRDRNGRFTKRKRAMNVTYEVRTSRNARVFAYDSLARAKEERLRAEKRIGVKMQIVKITHMEEVLHD